jgi:hypothetical protein
VHVIVHVASSMHTMLQFLPSQVIEHDCPAGHVHSFSLGQSMCCVVSLLLVVPPAPPAPFGTLQSRMQPARCVAESAATKAKFPILIVRITGRLLRPAREPWCAGPGRRSLSCSFAVAPW